MKLSETGLWIIVFVIAILFFILLCKSNNKIEGGIGAVEQGKVYSVRMPHTNQIVVARLIHIDKEYEPPVLHFFDINLIPPDNSWYTFGKNLRDSYSSYQSELNVPIPGIQDVKNIQKTLSSYISQPQYVLDRMFTVNPSSVVALATEQDLQNALPTGRSPGGYDPNFTSPILETKRISYTEDMSRGEGKLREEVERLFTIREVERRKKNMIKGGPTKGWVLREYEPIGIIDYSLDGRKWKGSVHQYVYNTYWRSRYRDSTDDDSIQYTEIINGRPTLRRHRIPVKNIFKPQSPPGGIKMDKWTNVSGSSDCAVM